MATCVERSGERLVVLCLRRLCCVSSAWPRRLGCGARARRSRPAATRPWLKLVFGPWRANFSTEICCALGCSSVVDVGNANSGIWTQGAYKRRPMSGRSHKSLNPHQSRSRAGKHEPAVNRGAESSLGTPTNPPATCGVRLALGGGGKLAPQFCARGGGAGLPSAHQRGATSAKKKALPS